MSERKSYTTPEDERERLARLKGELERLERDIDQMASFGKYDITAPAENEETYGSYLDKRPNTGIVRDGDRYRHADNNRFASEDQYYDSLGGAQSHYDELYDSSLSEQDDYDDMSLEELARIYGRSEATNDRTRAFDALDAIDTKIQRAATLHAWSQDTTDLHYATLMDIASKESGELDIMPDKEIEEDLVRSTNEYARLTARDRQSYFGRFAKTGLGKFLRKIPGVRNVINNINDKQSEEIAGAIENYEDSVNRHLVWQEKYLRSDTGKDRTDEEIRAALLAESINLDYKLEVSITRHRRGLAGNAGAFTDWWVSQRGFSGGLKKAGVVFGAGFATGALVATGVGLLGGAVVIGTIGSTVAGGATGGSIAHNITKRRANAVLADTGKTVAWADSEADHIAKSRLLLEGDDPSSDVAIKYTEQQTDEEMLRNRRRIKIAKGLGAAGGALAGLSIGHIFQSIHHVGAVEPPDPTDVNVPDDMNPTPTPSGMDTTPDIPPDTGNGNTAVDTSELLGNDFYIEPGNGFTHEWIDWAQVNGHDLSPHDAYQLHEAVRAHFGDNGIIEDIGTYIKNGDLRISSPGASGWDSNVAQFAKEWLIAHGEW